MKRIVALFLSLALLTGCMAVHAETVDLSALSFQELAALRDKIQCMMMEMDEWQEVTVPQGVYKVGEDIPAGTWLIKCSPSYTDSVYMESTEIVWGTELNETGTDIKYNGDKDSVEIFNPQNKHYEGGITEFVITLSEGMYLMIRPEWNSAVFTPYTGRPNLGFK